jgi:AcrR family transcriptional regulator
MVIQDQNLTTNFYKNDPATWTTKERILNAAIQLFAQKGFDGVSVRQIAKQTGIHESSLYNHFRSKDEILDAIFAIYQSELLDNATVREAAQDQMLTQYTPAEMWQMGFTRWRERMGTPAMLLILRIIALEQYRSPNIRAVMLKSAVEDPVNHFEKLFTKLMRMNLIKELDPHQLALEFQSYSTALVYEYSVLRYDGTLETQIAGMDEVEQKMRAHIRFFWDLIKR